MLHPARNHSNSSAYFAICCVVVSQREPLRFPLPELKEVKAEDNEDVSERFVLLNQEGRESDVIKRVNLEGLPIFIISLVEHKA